MCNDKNIKELLPGFQNQRLDPNDRKRIEEHLARCNDCRTELSLLSLMPDETVPDPGEAFWNAMPLRVSRAVRERQSGKNLFDAFRIQKWFILPARTYAAAAAIVLLLFSMLIITTGRLQNHAPFAADYVYHEFAANPVLTIHELSPAQLQSVDGWAARELSLIASEAASSSLFNFGRDFSEDLAELSNHEMEKLLGFLKTYAKEGSS